MIPIEKFCLVFRSSCEIIKNAGFVFYIVIIPIFVQKFAKFANYLQTKILLLLMIFCTAARRREEEKQKEKKEEDKWDGMKCQHPILKT